MTKADESIGWEEKGSGKWIAYRKNILELIEVSTGNKIQIMRLMKINELNRL